jgi:hypothetical protein
MNAVEQERFLNLRLSAFIGGQIIFLPACGE